MEQLHNPELEKYMVLAQEMMRRIYADIAPEMLHTWLMTQLALTGNQGNEGASLPWLESLDYYDQLLADRQARANLPPDQRREMTWAWASWNSRIDPLEAGLLAILAAGDGVGKTIYGETQAEHWARAGFKVAFVHFELNRAIMLDRRAARHTLVSRRELKSGSYSPETIRQWHDARQRLAAWDGGITYLHTPGWSMDRLTKQLRQHIENNECDVIVIDYLEKAQPSDMQIKMFGGNQFQREAHDVETIKTFAESTNTPVFCLAQMNKDGKTRRTDTLDRTAVRGAGEKTEKANIVVLLSRERDNEDGYKPHVGVRVDKNTLGPTGQFMQYMDGEHFRVYDLV